MDGPLPRRRTLRISNVDQCRKTPVSSFVGWRCHLALSFGTVVVGLHRLSINLDSFAHSLFSLAHTATGANPNDMFAVPNHLVGVKRSAGAVSPSFSNQTPTIGHLDLPTDIVIPLQQNEKSISPGCFASCIQGASMTHAIVIPINPSSGVVGVATEDKPQSLTLKHVSTSIEDGPNGECVLVYKELWVEVFYNVKWKKATIEAQDYKNKDD